jgi:hypothetical protein
LLPGVGVIEAEARQRQEEHDADHPLHALLDAQYSQLVTAPLVGGPPRWHSAHPALTVSGEPPESPMLSQSEVPTSPNGGGGGGEVGAFTL